MVGSLQRSQTTQAIGTAQPAPPVYTIASRNPAPDVVYVRTTAELDAALRDFDGPYGFDCEWKCMPRDSRVALVQLSNGSKVLLVQVPAMSAFPARLRAILEDPSIVKVGHAIEGDGARLRDDYGITVQNLFNIVPIAMRVDASYKRRYLTWRFIPVTEVVAHLLQRMLPKGPVRTSNWERVPLTPAQREYAAGDAHSVYEVYHILLARAASNNINVQGCGKIPVQNYSKGSFPDKFPLAALAVPAGFSKDEFGAYMMWDQGYGAADIQTTMARYPRDFPAPPANTEGVISLIVSALTKNTTLSYDRAALRALIESNASANKEHKAFLAKRCPIAPSSQSSGSKRSVSERKENVSETSSGSSSQRAVAPKRVREAEERETTPEEVPRRRASKRAAPSPEPGKRAVKRSRTM